MNAQTAQPTSLKALAQAVLLRNSQRTNSATVAHIPTKTAQQLAQQPIKPVHMPTLKEREASYKEAELKLEYNRLLKREQAGSAWIDDPCRTDKELEKGVRLYKEILARLNEIIDEIGVNNSTVEERMNGFNVPSLLGEDVSLEELPNEWK